MLWPKVFTEAAAQPDQSCAIPIGSELLHFIIEQALHGSTLHEYTASLHKEQ
jgi:hypothetical protein